MSGPDRFVVPTQLHEYRFAYENPSPATGRSLLHEVKECDGGQPGVCARSTTFDWTRNDNQFDQVNTSITGLGPYDFYFATGDLNGDGQDDIIWAHPVSNYYVYNYALSTGANFSLGPPSDFPQSLPNVCARPNPRLMDVNNDGRADLAEQECNSGTFTKVFLWNSATDHFAGGGTLTGQNSYSFPTYFMDANGDG